MKRAFLLVAGLVLSAVSQLHAASVFYDSFNYSPTGSQVSSAGSASWSLRNSPQVDPTMTSGSLSYSGLQTTPGGNSVLFNGTGASGIGSRQLGQIYNIGNVPTLYYSLTFKVTSITTADWGGTANFLTGSYMMGFSQDTSGALANPSAAAPLLIRTGNPTDAGGTGNDFQQYQLGTGVTAAAPTGRVFDGAHNYNPGDTLFLVLSYTFNSGVSNDVARLYVNPIPGSLEGANTPVVTTSGTVADVSNDQIQAFFLRNNSVEPAGTQIDDLRVGTTWADVTPIPEPSSAALVGCGLLALLAGYRLRERR